MNHPRLSAEQSRAWNEWGVEVVDSHLNRLMRRDGWLCDVIGRALARERRLMREHVKGELEALQREIAELRSQISLKK